MKKFSCCMISVFFLFSILSGCASTRTSQAQYVDSEKLVVQRDYKAAIKIIKKAKDKQYKKKDRVLYWLDIGLLYHYNREYEKSNQNLTDAEYAIEELYTKSVSKAMASGILNDNALDYFGEDYEDIYINVFKSLNYLHLNEFDSAFVEIRRIEVKLNLLEDKYKKLADEYNDSGNAETEMKVGENRFHNSALARYLSFLMYRADGDLDNARIDRMKIVEAFKLQPQLYDFPVPALPEMKIPRGKAAVNFIAFSGYGPVKLADTIYLQGGAGQVFVVVDSQKPDYARELVGFTALPFPMVDPTFHMKMQFPRMDLRGTSYDRVEVWVDGQKSMEMGKLEEMDRIAEEIFKIRLPMIVTKTIIRAVTKGVVKETATDAATDALHKELGFGGLLLGLAIDIASDVAVDATENADLRISHFFPARAWIGEIFLDPGVHDFEVHFYHKGQLVWVDEFKQYEISEGRLNLIEAFDLE